MTLRGATVALWVTLAALLVTFALLPCPARAQGVTTQCIVNVAAQGTPDAITSAMLPCGTTTNLVLLTAAAANVTTTPTYAPTGSPPLVITRANGGALGVGDLAPGYVALLSATGTSWVLLNPATLLPLGPFAVGPFAVGPGTITLTNGGTGYAQGDTITLSCPNVTFAVPPVITVQQVSSGIIIGSFLNNGGATSSLSSYNCSFTQASTSGAGVGATFTGVLLPLSSTLSVAGTPVGTLGYTQPFAKNYSNESANGYNGNFFLGYGTPNIAYAGNESVFLGSYAGLAFVGALSGNSTAVGEDACGGIQGVNTTTGGANTCIGNDAGRNIQGSSSTNTLVGFDVGRNINSNFNVGVGGNALSGNNGFDQTPMTGGANTAVGTNAMSENITGAFNVGVGLAALQANTSGSTNVAIGASTLQANTTGSNNLGIGANALTAATTASNNVAIGGGALATSTTGAANVAVGASAGAAMTTGGNNLLIGTNAGVSVLSTGFNNVLIGSVDTPGSSTSNMLNIGGLIYGNVAAAALTAPVVVGGVGPAIDAHATSKSGMVTFGTGALASGTITFAGAYSSWVHCRVTSHTALTNFSYSYTTAQIYVSATSLTSAVVDYDCDGY